jgi:hypothetical protein
MHRRQRPEVTHLPPTEYGPGVETHCRPDCCIGVPRESGAPAAAVDLPCPVGSLDGVECDRARSDRRVAALAAGLSPAPGRDPGHAAVPGEPGGGRDRGPAGLLGLIPGTARMPTRSRRPTWRWPRWPGPPGRLRGERCLIRTPKRPAGRPVSSRRIRLGATPCLSDARARRQAPVSGLPDSPVHRSWQGPDLTAVSTSPLSPPDHAIRIWLICL